MNQHLVRLSTRSMSRADWLAQRRKSIGGSDAAGIVGLSQYATPYTVWADKTGRFADQEDNEAMRQGRDLEGYVAERWMEATGKTVRRSNAILYNSLYPFAHADIDRTVVGENAGLECKTTSTLNLRQFKGIEFPEKYYAQCVHYLAVTGATRWYLAVLVYGRGFFTFTLERDQTEIDALMAAEQDFWKLVEQVALQPWMAWSLLETLCSASILLAEAGTSTSLGENSCCPGILNFNPRRKKSWKVSGLSRTPSRRIWARQSVETAEFILSHGNPRPGRSFSPRNLPGRTLRIDLAPFYKQINSEALQGKGIRS